MERITELFQGIERFYSQEKNLEEVERELRQYGSEVGNSGFVVQNENEELRIKNIRELDWLFSDIGFYDFNVFPTKRGIRIAGEFYGRVKTSKRFSDSSQEARLKKYSIEGKFEDIPKSEENKLRDVFAIPLSNEVH